MADRGAVAAVAADLQRWYRRLGRGLPWRRTTDPYEVLVAELMLQQTQVARVIPRYGAWLKEFPTLATLAKAPRASVLRAWQGLGYNRRAVYLHTLAREVSAAGGALPATTAELVALPGIGPYTAAAVACFAHGAAVAPMDVNALRVLHRLRGRRGLPPKQASPRTQLEGDALVGAGPPRELANALMDLGATVCTPRAPACPRCPLRGHCRGVRAGTVASTVRPHRRRGQGTTMPFERTDRYLRGEVVRRLIAAGPGRHDQRRLLASWPALGRAPSRARLERIVSALSAEGLLQRSRGRVWLWLPEGD